MVEVTKVGATCVRAYQFICMYDYNIILLYMQAQCICTSVRKRMHVRACECRPMCGRVCVHECARVGVLMFVYVCALVFACACVCACVSGVASVKACVCACGRSCMCACVCELSYTRVCVRACVRVLAFMIYHTRLSNMM